jgi:hypothetical protein
MQAYLGFHDWGNASHPPRPPTHTHTKRKTIRLCGIVVLDNLAVLKLMVNLYKICWGAMGDLNCSMEFIGLSQAD